jgi:hypothetical protein
LATLPGNRLAVFDAGNGLIRLIDLQKQTVSTIAKGINLRDMVYRPQDDSLYFSTQDKVNKLNVKSLAISNFFSANTQVPSPGALCLFHCNLCVADSNLPAIYEVKAADHPSSGTIPVSLSAVGNVDGVLALSPSEDSLYALQKGGFLVKVGVNSSVIHFPTPWGFLFKNQDHQGRINLLNIPASVPVGFSASPTEPRQFFIATEHSILSVKDYDFETNWFAMEGNGRAITDFEYPTKKPAKTYRILMIGSSRNSTSVPIPPDPSAGINEDVAAGDTKSSTYSKQLEFQLNTEAALQNLSIHFEVLNFTRRGGMLSICNYSCEVPDVVKKYDIDLVIGLLDHSGYMDYYLNPMTPEGVPGKAGNSEYMQKPLSARALTGPAMDLIKRCKELKIPVSEKQDYPGDGFWSLICNGDAQLEKDLQEMSGRRLQVFQDKLNSMRTAEGHCPQLVLFYAPGPYPNDCLASFWTNACARYHLKFLDLTGPFNALKTSYYPTIVFHFTAYGNELVSLLLSHYLIENKFIPFNAR